MQANDHVCLNLNEAFHRYQALGVIRNIRPRARVCIQGTSSRLVKALLLIDYQSAYWEPGCASAYAVAATFVMDGVNERSYQQIVNRAISKHGRGSQGQSYRAELEAFTEVLAHSGAVCIQRDETLLSVLASTSPSPILRFPEALDAVVAAVMYDGSSNISGLKDSFRPEQINWLIRDTLAIGLTTFTEDRLVRESEAGVHPGWQLGKMTQAA